MNPEYIFIGITLVGIGILLLYQVYYYFFGGKERDTKVIEIPLALTEFQKEIKQHYQNGKQQQQDKKDRLQEDLANGNAYIIPPKYFLISDWAMFAIRIIACFAIVVTMINFIEQFSNYSNMLARSCESIFGLNSFFFKDILIVLSGCIIVLFYLKVIMTNIVDKYKPKENNIHDNKPAWFSERLIYTNETTKEKETTTKNDLFFCGYCIVLIYLFLVFSSIAMVKDELLNFDIQGANEVYQQKCIAKEEPFHRLDEKLKTEE